MSFLKKHIGNVLFVLFIGVLLFTPQGFSIKVFLNELISFSPNVIEASGQEKVTDYNWDLYNPDLGAFNFNSAKGKVVFINKWATWCAPCVAEMPSIQKLYSTYNKEVVFLIITQDDANKVDAYLQKNRFTFPVFYQKSKGPLILTSYQIPTTFILDKEGNIVVKKTGASDWESDTVTELLDILLSR